MLLGVLKRWFFKGARWWQFWLPQSGPVGGVIVAGVIALLLLLALTGCAPLLQGVTGNAVCECEGLFTCSCVQWRD